MATGNAGVNYYGFPLGDMSYSRYTKRCDLND
jgi:hypothetical protein